MKQWYYKSRDEKRGPFTAKELKAEGITKESLVRTENMTNWDEAGNFEELMTVLEQPVEIIEKKTISNAEMVPLKDDIAREKTKQLLRNLNLSSLFLNAIYVSCLLIGLNLIGIVMFINNASVFWTNILHVFQTLGIVYLLYVLKRYLNDLNDHKKSDYIIHIYIGISLLSVIVLLFPENMMSIYNLIFIIISGILSLLLMINLVKIKNDFSGYIKIYGYYQFYCWLGAFLFFLLAVAVFSHTKLSIAARIQLYQVGMTISAIIGLMPRIILIWVFILTRRNLKVKI
jgi:hypothetical protein